MTRILIFFLLLFLISCQPSFKEWQLESTIDMGKRGPIGIEGDGDILWISDGNNNQLLQTNLSGDILSTIDSFERPMHIALFEGSVYIPEYGSDQVTIIDGEERSILPIDLELDAPAGFDITGERMAIADFYSNTIIIHDGSQWKVFGKKGNEDGAYHYPTDVQIFNDTLFIADAYNHRIQILTMDGKHVRNIGMEQDMNATTGIFVNEEAIYATDLENDRVLVFDHQGSVLQILEEGFDKPTDLMVHQDRLYVLNYGDGTIPVFTRK